MTTKTKRKSTAGRPFAPATGAHPAVVFDSTPRNVEPITAGFSPEALARLREAAKPKRKAKPEAATAVAEPPTAPEPEETIIELEIELELEPIDEPAPQPATEAEPEPTNPLDTFNLPTMADCPADANNFERRDFVCTHFHDWYEWWRQNWRDLPKIDLIRHIGVATSIWYRYEAKIRNGEKIAPREAPPAPTAPAPLPPFDLPTMADYAGDPTSNQQKNTYIMRHFPDWRQYQIDHQQTHAAMSRMTGVSLPAWRRHVANFKESPELYGRPLPHEAEPFDLPTMDDCADGASHIEQGAFVRQQMPAWIDYMQANYLSVDDMVPLTGLSRSAWYNHLAELAAPEPDAPDEGVATPAPLEASKTETLFEKWERELLEQEEARQIADELEPAFQLERERIARRQTPADHYGDLVDRLGNLVDDLRQIGAEVEVRVSYTYTHEITL